MSTSTKRRARQRTAQAAVAVVTTTDDKSCQVCHLPLDKKTMKNHGTEKLPYWMCLVTQQCDKRAGIIRDEAIAEDEAADEDAEPAEATT